MKPVVSVIDYGMGNLFSVGRAFESQGAAVEVIDTPLQISRAQYLVLPGVGAFADGMAGLHKRDLVSAVCDFAASGRPFLGICLGMQMMLGLGEEFGEHAGLGLIPGRVAMIPRTRTDGGIQKIPHIGWNELHPSSGRESWTGTILDGLTPGDAAYFVHSFAALPHQAHHRLADCRYGGHSISAVVRSASLYGCQFHPEKSGPVGLRILRNFLHGKHQP
jgi:imidazole glycerol-phosphate synthase subunit HisH